MARFMVIDAFFGQADNEAGARLHKRGEVINYSRSAGLALAPLDAEAFALHAAERASRANRDGSGGMILEKWDLKYRVNLRGMNSSQMKIINEAAAQFGPKEAV